MKKKMVSDKLAKALSQLALTEKEIAVYVALLAVKQASVQELARATGINRVSIYAALEELKGKGLLAESRRGKRKSYAAEDPESLVKLLDERKAAVEKDADLLQGFVLPMLKAINVRQENKPQIKFFEGADGINRVFDEYVLKSKEAINCGSYETATKVLTKKAELKYFERLKEGKIFYRMILEDTPLNRQFAEAGKGAAHTKFLPIDTNISADIVIAGATTILISYDRETATMLEDDSIAAAIKSYLDFMWERL
jgi:sugar-specific transcriptional regulator TrmB